MRTYDNGIYRDMTPEEIRALQEAEALLPGPRKTQEQINEELRRENAELRRMIEEMQSSYREGVNHAE